MDLELKFTLPGQATQSIPMDRDRILIGTLLSNDVVLRVPQVEPIHAMIEREESGDWRLTDLGSQSGVRVNGARIEVERVIRKGDMIVIGNVTLGIEEIPKATEPAPIVAPVGIRPPEPTKAMEQLKPVKTQEPVAAMAKTATSKHDTGYKPRETKRDLLFNPRHAKPSGDVLEVVSYWGDTILDVELFHQSFKGYEQVLIGDNKRCHFLAGDEKPLDHHLFAQVSADGFRLRMIEGMEGRFRRGGKVEKKRGEGSVNLGRRDLAHIKFGPLSYFLMFVRPPKIDLPRRKPKDPLFNFLMTAGMVLYFAGMGYIVSNEPKHEDLKKDDPWAVINIPEKLNKPKPEQKPKPEVKIAEKKIPPQKKPPPPKPKQVKPTKVVVKEKPKKVEQANANKTTAEKPTTSLAKTRTPTKETTPAKNPSETPSLAKLSSTGGMASTGASKPDFKKPGPTTKSNSPKSGGAQGSGMNQTGGARKGSSAVSVNGVEGPKNNKASGVNLSKLGLGAGKILNKTGPGAIATNFRNSAGGAGGGSGSASRTYGLGGVGSGKSLGLAGAGGAVNNFGSGSGGDGSGSNGTGGLGGAGLGKGFGRGEGGRGRANVSVPPGDPVVSGGLTSQEVQAVIRTNLNQIRHCYERLLQRSPNASGKIKVKFVVAPNGRVASSSIVTSSITDNVMTGCVTGVVRRWTFPPPRGGQSVTVFYPFVFNPV